MISSTFALASLQSNFKKSFESAEKDVELSITHVERALENNIGAPEISDLRKKVGDSFTEVKKQLVKFNSSALFFIGLNIDPLNPNLHDLVSGSRDELALFLKSRKRGKKNEENGVRVTTGKDGTAALPPKRRRENKPEKDGTTNNTQSSKACPPLASKSTKVSGKLDKRADVKVQCAAKASSAAKKSPNLSKTDLHLEVHVSAGNKAGSRQELESSTLKETVGKSVDSDRKGDSRGSERVPSEMISENREEDGVKDAVKAPEKASHDDGKLVLDLEEGEVAD